MPAFKQFGIVNNQIGADQRVSRVFSMQEHFFALDLLAKKRAKVYLWNAFGWDASYTPLIDESQEHEVKAINAILDKKSEYYQKIWIGMKPGDYRYCMHASDRRKFVANAKELCEGGIDGIFVCMNDTHSNGRVNDRDGAAQGELIYDLACALGSGLKGVCGEEYFGRELSKKAYWKPILARLPSDALIAWAGPNEMNESLRASDFPKLPRGLMVWDNYFVREFDQSKEYLFAEYNNRNPDLISSADAFLITLGVPIKSQLTSLASALDFCAEPTTYEPRKNFLMNVRFLQQEMWERHTGEQEYHPLYDR